MTVSPLASSASTACCTRRRSSSGVSWRPCSRYVTSGALRMARVRRSSSGRKTSQAMRCISVSFPPGGGVAGAVWVGGSALRREAWERRAASLPCFPAAGFPFRLRSTPFIRRGFLRAAPPHQSKVLGDGGEGATLLQKGAFSLPPISLSTPSRRRRFRGPFPLPRRRRGCNNRLRWTRGRRH